MLGADRATFREFADAELISQGSDATQAILWGRRATDPAIRDRCEWLWLRLHTCPDCRGVGAAEKHWANLDGGWWQSCDRCGGSGDLRRELAYDMEGELRVRDRVVEKSLRWEGRR